MAAVLETGWAGVRVRERRRASVAEAREVPGVDVAAVPREVSVEVPRVADLAADAAADREAAEVLVDAVAGRKWGSVGRQRKRSGAGAEPWVARRCSEIAPVAGSPA